MTINVNGTVIDDRTIDQEVQYHPSASLDDARLAAGRALVVRHVLLDEARRRGHGDAVPVAGETAEEAAIRALLAEAVTVPDADEATCRRYWERNPARFKSPDLFEACHILFPAAPTDAEARKAARDKAKEAITTLVEHPGRFADLARTLSACPSAKVGGNLGQVTRGQTVEELETFFYNLLPGTLCPVPVPSRYGYHVVRLDRRELGQVLPFEVVRERIAAYLHDTAWQRAVHQYIQILVGKADIGGIAVAGAASPLVQ